MSRPSEVEAAEDLTARCSCYAPATNQALYRRMDGAHFLGMPVCEAHRYSLGRLQFSRRCEIVDYMEIVP